MKYKQQPLDNVPKQEFNYCLQLSKLQSYHCKPKKIKKITNKLPMSQQHQYQHQHQSMQGIKHSNILEMAKASMEGKYKKAMLKCFEPGLDAGDCIVEETVTKPFAMSKLKISFDQEETKREAWEKGFSSLNKPNSKQQPAPIPIPVPIPKQALASAPLQIPANPKAQQIMSKQPLRSRLGSILPFQLQLPISYDHQQLLKRMQLIDRTIQFLDSHRGMKVFFFDTIKRSIFESSSILVEIKILQQLLFLDQGCYAIEWRMNDKIKRYDIKVTLPKVESMDLRKAQMRKKIVNYLIHKQGEFLAQKGITKIDNHKWHEQFQYQTIRIPQKLLPVHPNNQSTDLRSFPDQQISKIGNESLRDLFKTKKQKLQVKSLSSSSIADMIFSKISASEITNKIISSIREKQKINNQIKEREKAENEKVDKEAILRIYDEILLVFMSKNVSNIFKVTLVDILRLRLKFKDQLISQYLQKILNLPNLGCLKVIESSKKVQVIQIDKQKYKQGRNIVSANF